MELIQSLLLKLLQALGYCLNDTALTSALGISRNELELLVNEVNQQRLAEVSWNEGLMALHVPLPLVDIALLKQEMGDAAIHYLPVTSSTNTWCFEHLDADFPDGVVVVSDCQVTGKGRFARKWISPLSRQMIYSQAFHLQSSINDLYGFSEKLGIKFVDFFKHHGVKNCQVKWPNDVCVNHQKMGGILCEIRPFHDEYCLVVGIGINLQLPEDIEVGQEFTSLYLYQNITKETLIRNTAKIVSEALNETLVTS